MCKKSEFFLKFTLFVTKQLQKKNVWYDKEVKLV